MDRDVHAKKGAGRSGIGAVKRNGLSGIACHRDTNEIAVADNGPGIAPAHRDVVFERFRQLGDALGDKPQGAGLGLAISQRIIERHGGRIWIDEAEEGGARFRISLHAAETVTG